MVENRPPRPLGNTNPWIHGHRLPELDSYLPGNHGIGKPTGSPTVGGSCSRINDRAGIGDVSGNLPRRHANHLVLALFFPLAHFQRFLAADGQQTTWPGKNQNYPDNTNGCRSSPNSSCGLHQTSISQGSHNYRHPAADHLCSGKLVVSKYEAQMPKPLRQVPLPRRPRANHPTSAHPLWFPHINGSHSGGEQTANLYSQTRRKFCFNHRSIYLGGSGNPAPQGNARHRLQQDPS